MNTLLQNTIRALPHVPGVYIFKNSAAEIIYIGKAKDLRNRCTSYISPDLGDIKGQAIATTATSVEYIETKSEVAALVLEAELIQHHRPQLNILLKDGQPFLYLVVTTEKIPQLLLTRTKTPRGSYFGPFIEKQPIRALYNFLTKTFRLDICNKNIPSGCLRFHMGICSGSCTQTFDEAGYRDRLMFVKKLLSGGSSSLFKELDDQISKHNEAMEFEISRKLVEYKQNVGHFFANKTSTLDLQDTITQKTSRHVWIQTPKKVIVLNEQKLKFIELYSFIADAGEPLDAYLTTYYQQHPAPASILVDDTLEDPELLKNFLVSRWNSETESELFCNPTGHLEHIVRLAQLQIIGKEIHTDRTGVELQKFLELPSPPRIIDCFDISHTQGTNIVGASVRFVDGVPDKSGCRKFIIQSLTNQNDYAALQEVAFRRYKSHDELPDLLLIDGGKGQLNAVLAVVLDAVECASIAKREERIFSTRLPAEGKVLLQRSKAGKTLMALRDYAHHFAISFHRSRRTLLPESKK